MEISDNTSKNKTHFDSDHHNERFEELNQQPL